MDIDIKKEVEKFEFSLIYEAMKKANNNKTLAAKYLNMKRTTIVEKIKRLVNAGAHLSN